MKRIYFLILFLFVVAQLHAQGVWTQKANFPGISRTSATGFSIGGKGYITAGTNGQSPNIYYPDLWEYDQPGNFWNQKSNFSGIARNATVSFSIGTKGYVGTGANSSVYYSDFWEWDQVTDTWTQKANFGGAGRFGAVGFSIGTKGYIGTGWGNTAPIYKQDFWEWDQATNTWTQKANFGGAGRGVATGFSIGNNGYIGTGYNGTFHNDFWEWNQSTNTWTQKANFGGPARNEAIGFSIGQYGYIGLGTTQFSSGTLSDFWQYDVSTNTWTSVSNFGAGLREYAAGFSINCSGYVGTGWINDVPSSVKNDFWEFIPNGFSSVAFISSSAVSICSGQSVTLTASGGSNYSWSNGSTSNPIIVSPLSSSTYSVIASGSCGTDTAAIPITISNTYLDPGNDITLCEGNSAQLTGGGNATSYTWNPASSLSNPNSPSPVASPTVTTTYTVTGTNSIGCTAVDSVSVFVNPTPAVPTVTLNGDTLVSSPAAGYQWYLNGNPISGAVSQTYLPPQNGSYQVMITDANGCTSLSATFYYTLSGINENTNQFSFSIFPNPSEGIFFIESSEKISYVEITNLFGEIIYRSSVLSPRYSVIDLSSHPRGIYFIKLIEEKNVRIEKLIVE